MLLVGIQEFWCLTLHTELGCVMCTCRTLWSWRRIHTLEWKCISQIMFNMTPFFTAVYIVEWLVLQTIYVPKKEMLWFLGKKSAVYNQERFMIKKSVYTFIIICCFRFLNNSLLSLLRAIWTPIKFVKRPPLDHNHCHFTSFIVLCKQNDEIFCANKFVKSCQL